MKVYIMADLEGISGIYSPEQVIQGQRRFDEGRKYLTRDINICAEACKEAGVEKVCVRDAHGGSYTLLWDQLSDAVDEAICGITGDDRFAGIEEYDAVILLGYHAMAGTPHALLEHTMSSARVQNYWLNGTRIGETALDAAILGDLKKPVIMVSGDDALCREAKEFLPWVTAVEVKKSASCFGTSLLSPALSKARIREGVKDAIAAYQAGSCDLYRVCAPVTLRCEVTERQQIPSAAAKPYMRVIDGRTYEITADSAEEALHRI